MSRDRRPHIGIYGRRNSGKSTLLNSITGQQLSVVSSIPGTTTDPVKKSIELPHFGPVILFDTAGIDDIGELGIKRVEKTLETIELIDLAILVVSGNRFDKLEDTLIQRFKELDIPFLIIHNKEDKETINDSTATKMAMHHPASILQHHHKLKTENIIEAIIAAIPESAYTLPSLLGRIINPGEMVMMITPIDESAPEGRLILPQVQAIRDVLDNDAVCVVLKESQIENFIQNTSIRPKLVVTDSQIFKTVAQKIPEEILLTSFSILLANFKGDFESYKKGTPFLSQLRQGDRVLILESCTHHVSCNDIGRSKLPAWINRYTGLKLDYDVVAGLSPISNPPQTYAMAIQCGGCMITRKQLISRLKPFTDHDIPLSNYGMTIAYINGIFDRAIKPFE